MVRRSYRRHWCRYCRHPLSNAPGVERPFLPHLQHGRSREGREGTDGSTVEYNMTTIGAKCDIDENVARTIPLTLVHPKGPKSISKRSYSTTIPPLPSNLGFIPKPKHKFVSLVNLHRGVIGGRCATLQRANRFALALCRLQKRKSVCRFQR